MAKYLKMFAAAWSGGSKKKIILSLSVIGIVCAIAVGVTVSYFRDTETSTGNKFVAGKLNLKIDNTCHYNGMVCTAGKWTEESTGSSTYPDLIGEDCACTWSVKDLAGELFFNFLDVKPGDEGEDTVSLHIDNNDAWVCAELTNLVSDDNGCDKPESDVDNNCGAGEGELQENLFFTIWKDTDCDNVLDQEAVPGYCTTTNPDDENYCSGMFGKENCYNDSRFDCDWIEAISPETVVVQDQSAQDLLWPIADSTTGSGPIPGDETYCLGIAWNVPIETGNIIQTDSLEGDVIFNAVQARNMKNFKCSDLYTEVCGDQKDNDYDGQIDEGCIVCGDGVIGGTETCELPGTSDNSLCAQSPWRCEGLKIQTRDSYGDCGASCGCVEDPWGPLACSSRCNAGCETDHDCEDNNPATADTCNLTSCGCENVCIPSTEVCDTIDNDCDGQIDEGNPGGGGSCSTGLLGICSAGILQCQSGGQLQCVQTSQPSQEMCNGVDDDCDGGVDMAPFDWVEQFYDVDGDGYGDPNAVSPYSCATPGFVSNRTDCNDNNSATHPGATEVCNGVDDDCDRSVDESFPGMGDFCTYNAGNPPVPLIGGKQCVSGAIICAPLP